MGQGVSLNYPACLPELLPNGWSSITVQRPAFWDWTYPWWTVKAEDAHTGFTAGKRLSPDIAGAGALGAAEAGPGRSLARWGMGKEGNGDVLGQRQAAECSLLPCGPNPSSCHLGYCYGSMAQEGQGGVKMVLVLTGWPALTHVST